jgi:hypothetical protein
MSCRGRVTSPGGGPTAAVKLHEDSRRRRYFARKRQSKARRHLDKGHSPRGTPPEAAPDLSNLPTTTRKIHLSLSSTATRNSAAQHSLAQPFLPKEKRTIAHPIEQPATTYASAKCVVHETTPVKPALATSVTPPTTTAHLVTCKPAIPSREAPNSPTMFLPRRSVLSFTLLNGDLIRKSAYG